MRVLPSGIKYFAYWYQNNFKIISNAIYCRLGFHTVIFCILVSTPLMVSPWCGSQLNSDATISLIMSDPPRISVTLLGDISPAHSALAPQTQKMMTSSCVNHGPTVRTNDFNDPRRITAPYGYLYNKAIIHALHSMI